MGDYRVICEIQDQILRVLVECYSLESGTGDKYTADVQPNSQLEGVSI